MTVSTTIIKNFHNGNGSATNFAYQFRILQDTDLLVIIRTNSTGAETTKTLSTHYTVAGAGDASGGSITFTAGNIPASGETVVIRRNVPQTQAIDYIANDPFPAETHEEGLDRGTMVAQQVAEESDRSIKLSRTNTMTSTEFTVGATDRANKILAFDSSGEISVTQELGTFKGSDATTTTAAYVQRDIIKSTTAAQLNNVYICVADSVVGDLLTDTDHFELLVDAVSAATSETNAAASEAAAASSATDAETAQTAAETAQTNAETAETNAETAETNAETAQAAAEVAQAAAEAALDNFDDRFLGAKASDPTLDNDGNALLDGALYFNTTDDVMKVYDLTNTTWRQIQLTTSDQANVNIVAADLSGSNNIGTVAGLNTEISNLSGLSSEITNLNNIRTDISGVNSIQAAVSAVNTNAGNINAVNSNSANINTVAGLNTEIGLLGTSGTVASINTVASNLADVNAFANIYLGPNATAPTLDPDGSALDVGDLYFDTVSQTMKVYSSSGWIPAGSSVNGTSSRFTYTVSSSTTTITGADDNTNTLAYDAGFIDVYLNGVKMVNGTDVTVTSGTSIVFASPIGVSGTDVVDIIAFGTFQLSNFSINDANDVSTGGVTDGQVLVYNTSASTFQPGNASSAEVYGFNKNASGQLIITTTNGGADSIDSATFDTFNDVLFSASGFVFSVNNNGNLVATI